MKITEVKTELTFGELAVGDVFKHNNEHYIKIEPIENDATKERITAIHLITGHGVSMKYGAKVTPVVAELTVKDL